MEERKKEVFGFGVVFVNGRFWIAKKEKLTTASADGKTHEREAYEILKLPKNGFEGVSDALEYLSQLSEEI